MAKPNLNIVLSTLKACVISNPEGVDEDRLNSDYKSLMGCNIPYKELGFTSLADLIKDSQSLKVITRQCRRIVVVQDSKADHLSSLIKSQKKTTKKRKNKQFLENFSGSGKRGGYRGGVRGRGWRGSGSARGSFKGAPPSIREQSFLPPPRFSSFQNQQSSFPPLPKTLSSSQHFPASTPTYISASSKSHISASKPPVSTSRQHSPPQNEILQVTLNGLSRQVHRQPQSAAVNNLAQKRLDHASTVPESPQPPVPTSKRNSTKIVSIKEESKPIEGSYSDQFIKLVRKHGWPDPEYRILPRRAFDKTEVYACTVTGTYNLNNSNEPNDYNYSTIPNEFCDLNVSKEAVSKKACDDMMNKIKQASNHVPLTTDLEMMIQRVREIVIDHPRGYWAFSVQSDYKIKFNEQLPENWIDVIASTGQISAEKLADFSYVIHPEPQISEKKQEDDVSLGELVYPPDEDWDIFVTKVVSPCEVWFRFVGLDYSDWYENVDELMRKHYKEWSMFVSHNLQIGEIYVYPGQIISRVLLLSLDSPSLATVWNIDHGDKEQVPRSHLCELDKMFKDLPPQAVSCKVAGLIEFENNILAKHLLTDKLEDKVLVAKRLENVDDLQLQFYDTSGEEPFNINDFVLENLLIDLLAPPMLPQNGAVSEIIVSSVWKTGDIYIQIPNKGLEYIEEELSDPDHFSADFFLADESDLQPNTLYIVHCSTDYEPPKWRRATILHAKRPHNSLVELMFVDTGDICSVHFADLIPLSHFSSVLCAIPKQAVKVCLHGVNCTDRKTIDRLLELLPVPKQALIKLSSADSTNIVPQVEMFVRESVNQALVSINTTLIIDSPLHVPSPPSRDLKCLSIDPGDSFSTISPVRTPEPNNYYDVYVVSVASPTNFTIIPLDELKNVQNLQTSMSKFYSKLEEGKYKLQSYKIGQACAVQHSDNMWYRGLIAQVVDRSMNQLMIRFCDFGNLAMVSAERIRALDEQFLHIPGLGFNAKIADICPLYHDWSLSDIDRAQRLMLEKKLVSFIKDIIEEDDQKILILNLYDTTTKEEINIGELLINESRAKYLNNNNN